MSERTNAERLMDFAKSPYLCLYDREQFRDIADEFDDLRRKLAIATAALEKYADKSNWVGGSGYDDAAFDEFWLAAEDGWLTAADALDAIGGA